MTVDIPVIWYHKLRYISRIFYAKRVVWLNIYGLTGGNLVVFSLGIFSKILAASEVFKAFTRTQYMHGFIHFQTPGAHVLHKPVKLDPQRHT